MKYPRGLRPKLKRRYKYLINKVGYNPLDFGFDFDWFFGRSLCFSKKLKDRTILLTFNYWFGKSFFSLYKNTYSTELFSFKNEFPNERNFRRLLCVSEKHKRIGVPGYHYQDKKGRWKFQYDESYK